jgi:hypothetical protein
VTTLADMVSPAEPSAQSRGHLLAGPHGPVHGAHELG